MLMNALSELGRACERCVRHQADVWARSGLLAGRECSPPPFASPPSLLALSFFDTWSSRETAPLPEDFTTRLDTLTLERRLDEKSRAIEVSQDLSAKLMAEEVSPADAALTLTVRPPRGAAHASARKGSLCDAPVRRLGNAAPPASGHDRGTGRHPRRAPVGLQRPQARYVPLRAKP